MQAFLERLLSKVPFTKEELNLFRRSLNALHKCRKVQLADRNIFNFACRYHENCRFKLLFRQNSEGLWQPAEGYQLYCGKQDEILQYNNQLERVCQLKSQLMAYFQQCPRRLLQKPGVILNVFFGSKEEMTCGIDKADLQRSLRKKFDNVVNEVKRKLVELPQCSEYRAVLSKPYSVLGFPESQIGQQYSFSEFDQPGPVSFELMEQSDAIRF